MYKWPSNPGYEAAMNKYGNRELSMVSVGPLRVGPTPLISAEIGINHQGNVGTAKRLVDMCIEAGADLVKLQLFKTEDFADELPETVTYKQMTNGYPVELGAIPEYREVTEPAFDLFKRHELTAEQIEEIGAYCNHRGIPWHITPTSPKRVHEAARMPGMCAFKVASDMAKKPEILTAMREYDLPVIISTGHLEFSEIHEIACPEKNIVLHCVSEYPCENPKLWKIGRLKEMGFVTGYSHHGRGIADCVRAAELGAVLIEAHVTLSHESPGPDHWWSLDTPELKALCKAIK